MGEMTCEASSVREAEHAAREVDEVRGVLGVGERLAVVDRVALVELVTLAHRRVDVHVAVLAQERRGRVDADLLAVVHEQDVVGLEGMGARRIAAALGVDRRRVRRVAVVHAPDVGVEGGGRAGAAERGDGDAAALGRPGYRAQNRSKSKYSGMVCVQPEILTAPRSWPIETM